MRSVCCVFLPAAQDAAAFAAAGGARPASSGRRAPTVADLREAQASVIEQLVELAPLLAEPDAAQLALHEHRLVAAFDTMWHALRGIKRDVELIDLPRQVCAHSTVYDVQQCVVAHVVLTLFAASFKSKVKRQAHIYKFVCWLARWSPL
jgi:hypothetical protein